MGDLVRSINATASWIFSPSGVFLRTLSRKMSPELIDASCGNRERSLSVCVPFPTPGAPMRMMRAALVSCFVADVIPLNI